MYAADPEVQIKTTGLPVCWAMASAMKAALLSSLNVRQVKCLFLVNANVRGALLDPGQITTSRMPFSAQSSARRWIAFEFTGARYYGDDITA